MSSANAKRLEINIFSIVIGALIFIVIRSWSELIGHLSDIHTGKGYEDIEKDFITTLFLTFGIIFIIIMVYSYAKSKGTV